MPVIDPTSDVGKLRLFCGDWGDIVRLPDEVYTQTLTDANGNFPVAAKTCAMYILSQLAFKTHRKMGLQLEVWGAEAFENYKAYLMMAVKDPTFSNVSPIPYSDGGTCPNELVSFISDWKRNYYTGTQSQRLAFDADISPNDGSRYGPLAPLQGWIPE